MGDLPDLEKQSERLFLLSGVLPKIGSELAPLKQPKPGLIRAVGCAGGRR